MAPAGRGRGAVVKIVRNITPAQNKDRYDPCDGEMIGVCDKFAAYVEASLSIDYGVRPASLVAAKKKVFRQFRTAKIDSFNFGRLFSYFS